MKGFINRTIFALLGAMAMSAMADTVKLENIEFAALSGDRFQVLATFSDTPPEPTGYTIDNPARIVIDMPGVESALDEKKHALSFENARSAVVLTAGDKTRMILNMVTMANYSTRVDGNKLIVDVGSSAGGSMVAQSDTSEDNVHSMPASSGGASIENVDFRRGENGQGLITIDLSDPSVNVDINRIGNSVTLDFYRTALPESLDRRLDVVDFATPVRTIDTSAKGANTTIAIEAMGEYDYLAYQADNQYVVSIKPLTQQELEEKKSKFAFTGEKLSLNMQDIPVRSVLQVIADFTKLNLVASDTVSGSITLRLENVPWDQALDIILKAKGLDKRQEGNVIMVAPAEEIAEQERLQVEANKQLQELAPLRTEFVRIRYADARELFDLFVTEEGEGGGSRGSDDRNATSSILSVRGSAIVDERTNTIILTDTEEKIADFRRLIKEIDIPIKQVVIESRIVIANTDFREELGVKWGFISNGSVNGNSLVGTGRRDGFTEEGGVLGNDDNTIDINSILAADLGVTNPTSSLALAYITDNYFLDMELSALEDAGRGEIVSQPKVITGDKQEAIIQTGTEIPYLEASSSGAASISFREAVLKLEVKPQITPDNRIIMNLFITQDSLGEEVALLGSSVPTIDLTRIQTQALVGNGQTMVLGGIFQVQELERTEKVPLLGDIPFVGRLFRNDVENYQKREILIFITPKIITDQLLDTN
ncbi:type IV pilus secretin PilQ [Porticoccaceae bacterium LTM1]|nr:type IV pilus secretin PilQ [Porticoccaceae bacterium LTM1]